MMQVPCLLQRKQRYWPLSDTGTNPSTIVSCIACPRLSLLFRFLAHGSLHEVLAWEASGCSNDNVFAKLPSQDRHSPYRVSSHGPLGC